MHCSYKISLFQITLQLEICLCNIELWYRKIFLLDITTGQAKTSQCFFQITYILILIKYSI